MKETRRFSQSSWHIVLPLLCGIGLGPQGLGILSTTILALVDPVVPIALAALGILVVFELGRPQPGDAPALAFAAGHALAGAALVTAAGATLLPLLSDLPEARVWRLAAMLGVCATCSSALGTGNARTGAAPSRIVDLDAIVVIAAGAVAIAVIGASSLPDAGWLLLRGIGVTLLVAAAGWLLLGHTMTDIERRIFGLAVLLLLGGVADYLSLSALFGGFVAAGVWQTAGGSTREAIRQDLSQLQHPTQLVVLVMAGARAEWSVAVVVMAMAYVFLRAIGKLAAGLAIGAATGARGTRNLASRLVSPGILAVAFALNATRALGSGLVIVLSIVVLGTIALQLVAGSRDAEAPA